MKKQLAVTELDGFDEFWASYPKHKAKKEAQKAWQQLRPDSALRRRMLDALSWQRRQPEWVKDGGVYVPNAASWIRGERWEDEQTRTPVVSDKTARSLRAIYGD